MIDDFADAHLGAGHAIDFLGGPAHVLPVVQIHALEHAGPIVGLGAAVPGLNGHEAAAMIMFAIEQRLQFHLAHAADEIEEFLVRFTK